MQDDPNRKAERQRGLVGSADGTRAIGDSIKQAFLTHMGEQQRQYPTGLSPRPAAEVGEPKRR